LILPERSLDPPPSDVFVAAQYSGRFPVGWNLLQRKDMRSPQPQTQVMTTRSLTVVLLAAMAATIGVARARRAEVIDPNARTFEVTGVVTAPPADGRVTVAHDAISGYMPAMTMPFAIGPEAPALAPGDRVRFTLEVAANVSRAAHIVVSGRDEAVAAAARDAAASTRTRLKKGDALPAFSLETQDGRAFTADDLRGRLTAVTFIFTRCPVPEFCPLMSKRFQQVQRDIERDPALRRELEDVRLVSVTLDPAFDTPPVLDAYAKAIGANPARWQFVTGRESEVARLTSAFAIHVERNGVLLDHTLATAVIDAEGRIVEIWRGTGWKVADVVGVLTREAARRN
jgi:protein SCO1/2